MCYGTKQLEFAKGKNAIEFASEGEVADSLLKVRDAWWVRCADKQQARFGRWVTQKNKWIN